jgi:hypothetical protein
LDSGTPAASRKRNSNQIASFYTKGRHHVMVSATSSTASLCAVLLSSRAR